MLLAVLVGTVACADFRRGDYWVEPGSDEEGGGSEGGATSSSPEPDTGEGPGDEGTASSGGSGDGPSALSFALDVYPLLEAGCERCHSPDGQANATSFILDGDVEAAYATTLELVDLDDPDGSRLLAKTAGLGHTGGVIFDDRSSQYETILAWIEQGANP
ncbi:MAG: hypothetical protein KC501_05730 [Myxococcales bacterium]|nr:hypothetical protein [Myxococcales bacterium]